MKRVAEKPDESMQVFSEVESSFEVAKAGVALRSSSSADMPGGFMAGVRSAGKLY